MRVAAARLCARVALALVQQLDVENAPLSSLSAPHDTRHPELAGERVDLALRQAAAELLQSSLEVDHAQRALEALVEPLERGPVVDALPDALPDQNLEPAHGLHLLPGAHSAAGEALGDELLPANRAVPGRVEPLEQLLNVVVRRSGELHLAHELHEALLEGPLGAVADAVQVQLREDLAGLPRNVAEVHVAPVGAALHAPERGDALALALDAAAREERPQKRPVPHGRLLAPAELHAQGPGLALRDLDAEPLEGGPARVLLHDATPVDVRSLEHVGPLGVAAVLGPRRERPEARHQRLQIDGAANHRRCAVAVRVGPVQEVIVRHDHAAALALPEVLGQHHNLGPRQREPGSPHRRRERPQRQLAGPPPVVVQEGLAQARDVGVPRLVLVGHGVALELQQGHVEVRRALDGLRGPAFVVEDEVDEVLVAVREQEMSAE
jgi:hypothetical protein